MLNLYGSVRVLCYQIFCQFCFWHFFPLLALGNSDPFSYDGIIEFGSCSAAYVRFPTSLESDQALILTNAHCLRYGPADRLGPRDVVVDQLQFYNANLLDRSGRYLSSLHVYRIIYAAVSGYDLALLELTEPYASIKERAHIDPLVISEVPSSIGEPVDIPSGLLTETYSCVIDGFVLTLKESEFLFRDSIRFSGNGCNLVHGTSGAPVISLTSKKIVGINNTGNEDGEECELNNPCEIDQQGNITVIKGRKYGQQTWILNTCLNLKREFDLSQKDCLLPKQLLLAQGSSIS